VHEDKNYVKKTKLLFGFLISACISVSLVQPSLAASEKSNTQLAEQELAVRWLQKMARAAKTENYQGRSIFHNGTQMVSLKIIHAMVDGEPWDRVVHLSGEPAEILRKGNKISCLHPASTVELSMVELSASMKTVVTSEVPLTTAFNGDALVMSKQYQLRIGREGRVAGRLVQVINVIPIDRARYGYLLAIDKETGLLLKTVMLNGKGKALEIFEFVDIAIGGVVSKDDFSPGEGVIWLASGKPKHNPVEAVSSDSWRAEWLPEGFNLAENEVRHIDGVNVNAQVYSDGLAAFTIFMGKYDPINDVEGSKQRGATIALSRRLPRPNSNYFVTVVGEVPKETALLVAASVTKD